jgi:WhiB family redox-sensing transcriptional regulator
MTGTSLAGRIQLSDRTDLANWMSRAACAGEDPELFFPIGETGPDLWQILEAKQVCARCDVKEACLRWALESGQDAGIWGGLTESERRAFKHPTRRATSPRRR